MVTTVTIKRFTPTGVGTMVILRHRQPPHPVHPHGRGDNRARRSQRWRIRGSPPRAWGQWARRGMRRTLFRFTPTGVGTMVSVLGPPTPTPVHPHGRGDNYQCSARHGYGYGSPPRAWGQCRDMRHMRSLARFTPTGVGTMLVWLVWSLFPPVHPHGRGDNSRVRSASAPPLGSPPRAWGQSRLG